jgi:hypothetical protein
MSISTAQYIDLLFKKLQGVAKTATATQKSASNESIASPALLRGDIVWTQADQIPGTAQVVANVTQGYLTTSRIECTADNTVPTIGGIYPTWLTNLQYWIPQEFGSTWPVKVWVDTAGAADPTVTGTQIFAPGISGVGEFFFDTQAGVLNFIGETIPSTLTAGKSIFITGYRYVGQLGVTNLPSANIGNIQITGNTIATLNTNGDLVFDPNGSGSVIILANTSVTGNITATGLISVTGNVTGNYFIGNGSQLTGVTASSVDANALTGNTLSSNVLYSSLTSVGTLSNVSVSGNVIGGNVLTGGLISATGNITGNNLNAAGLSLSGNVLSVINSTSNITTTANAAIGNLLTDGLYHANGVAWDFQQPAGSNTQIQYNDGSGGFGASANFTFNDSTQLLSVAGAQSVTGNITTSGQVSATGNITGGNILTVGIVSTSGNVYGNAILSDYYYYANGTPVPPGIIYTANTAPPTSPAPKVTDQWYDTASDVLYEYINDGTSTYWVDTTSPAFAGGVVANVAISGTLVPVANVTYDIGTNTVYFRNTYTQNLYTNNRLTASNMPSGAVVQTIMSTSLGGSATTGTSYSDIALANVVIQPSSANSKVLIIATGTSSFTPLAAANLTASTQLVRTAASLQIQDYSANIAGGGVGGSSAVAFSYLDSPGTTSPVTYKMQQKISNSSSTLTSSNMWIIAMEIAVP